MLKNIPKDIDFDWINNDEYIYKSNDLIESNYSLSVNEQRLIYLGAKKLKPIFVKSNVKPSDLTTYASTQRFGNLKISLSEFRKEFGLKGNYLYSQLETAANELFNREIMYHTSNGYVKKRWVITSKYDKSTKCVSLTFHPDLILDLLIFKSRYSKLQHNATKKLTTGYAFRFYEILKSSVHLESRNMTLVEIKEKLGISLDKYKVFTKLKRDVIDKSIDAINEYTDIQVDYEPIKVGRAIDSVTFNIRIKENNEMVECYDIPDKEHMSNLIKIIGHKINNKQADILTNSTLEAIKLYDLDIGIYDYIKEKVKVIALYSRTAMIKNYFAVLNKAIIENWQPNIIINNKNVSFNNYNQRNYTKDEMNDLEKKLLGWDED